MTRQERYFLLLCFSTSILLRYFLILRDFDIPSSYLHIDLQVTIFTQQRDLKTTNTEHNRKILKKEKFKIYLQVEARNKTKVYNLIKRISFGDFKTFETGSVLD